MTDSFAPNIYKIDLQGNASIFSTDSDFPTTATLIDGEIYYLVAQFPTLLSGNDPDLTLDTFSIGVRKLIKWLRLNLAT